MAPAIVFEEQFEVPPHLQTLEDFRRWALSAGFPDRGRIDWVGGRIEVDMSPEDLLTHGVVKTELVVVLGQRIKRKPKGLLFTDSTRVSSAAGDLSAEPDLVFVSNAALEDGRARLVEKSGGDEGRYVEIDGAADLVVEIVSDSSVGKDTRRLPSAYFAAGVEEFWLVDALGDEVVFRIHRRGDEAFVAVVPDSDGFQLSSVLGHRYRLDRTRNDKARWEYELREER